MRNSLSVFLTLLFFSIIVFNAEAKIEGFYCDVFQDEGTDINGPNMKTNCDFIYYSMEHLNTSNDINGQAEIMIENENDDNGYLLYPDGNPRFAIIYYHGGSMGHSTDLGSDGRQRVRDHYYHGGSQFGSCAGSYMLSSSGTNYFKIWPGRMNAENISNTRVDKIINEGSPFIGILDFEVGEVISNVYHNNGGSVDTTDIPDGTVICAMHNSTKLKGYADIWSWKDNDTTGRVLGITGHPEGNSATAQKRYMGACMLYLTQCLGKPNLKSNLENGVTIQMDKETSDNDPLRTKIGDKQYHHFLLDCKDAKNVEINVNGEEGFDFHLFVAKDTFAFNNTAEFADSTAGNSKTLTIPRLETGTWYVGVKLNTAVDTRSGNIFPEYYDNLEVLNGIGYSVKTDWEEVAIYANMQTAFKNQFAMTVNKKNVQINVGTLPVKSLQIFNARGRLCWEPKMSKEIRRYTWQPKSAGMYIARLVSGEDILTRRITVVK
jgi:hypothetical protein